MPLFNRAARVVRQTVTALPFATRRARPGSHPHPASAPHPARVPDAGPVEAAAPPVPPSPAQTRRGLEQSTVDQQAIGLRDGWYHAMTLENTPAAFLNGTLAYGIPEGDAPMSEDAGSQRRYQQLCAFVRAHPELAATPAFADWLCEPEHHCTGCGRTIVGSSVCDDPDCLAPAGQATAVGRTEAEPGR